MVKSWKYLKDLNYKDKIFREKGVYILYELKTKAFYIGCSVDIYKRLKHHFLKYKSKSMICGILLNGKEEKSVKFPVDLISEIYYVDKSIKNWHYKLESLYIKRYNPNLNSFNLRNNKIKHKDLILELLRNNKNSKKSYILEIFKLF